MTLSITLEQLLAMEPCGVDKRRALFGRRKKMNAKQALAAGASVDELLWVAGRLGLKRECVTFSLRCAQRVAHLNPDPRVQAALDATQAWLDNPCYETAARAAARAAHVAARAPHVAYAAARVAARDPHVAARTYAAAYAAARVADAAATTYADAYAAARAAARAADSYAAAARAADSDSDAAAAEGQAQQEIFLEIFG